VIDTPLHEGASIIEMRKMSMVVFSKPRAWSFSWVAVLIILILGYVGTAEAADREGEKTTSPLYASVSEGIRTVVDDIHAMVMRPLTMDRADALLVGGGLVVLGGAFATDHALRQLVVHHPSQTGRNISDDVGTVLGPGPLAGLSAGVTLLGFLGDSPGYRTARTTGLVALEAEGIAVAATAVLKVVTGRSAPDANRGTAHFRPFSGLDGSFASTHAAASFAVATVFAERYPGPIAWTAYTLASAVSVSRIYSDQHFGSDVVAGALLGWGMGYFLANRHADPDKSWQVRPLTLDRGLGSGILLSHRF
jgi:membrane-associated phospholipid phosphatase